VGACLVKSDVRCRSGAVWEVLGVEKLQFKVDFDEETSGSIILNSDRKPHPWHFEKKKVQAH